ncbi:hypothetical protein [Streptomyces sp. NPDC056883]|uniref:hypothetical protein n=1 Tax=Streptomyces sp. NPDC056883 TaxID=3345959 RepID=UPI0036C3E675
MITIPTLVVLVLIVAGLLWKAGLPWYMALPCVLLGLLLADTPVGPMLHGLLDTAAGAASNIRV